ncbi:MAG TPA: hypothetical protein VFM36_16965 [Thermoanaerobaculia bacterium]|nr:hypothetical protein [Thermoanaerobaculia bacterium]
MNDQRRRYRMHAVGATAVLAAAIYLSSGTMAPYGATDSHPFVLEPCHYLVNVDHHHFEAVYLMIRGVESAQWAGSVVLRRLLFPVISYPLVMAAGFLAGGLIASILLNVAALLVFASFVRRRVGEGGATATLWLLATYPGITYWAGLPYSYVAIVPGSLFGLMLLYRMQERVALKDVVRAAFLLGLIFTAYDLFPFFGPAAVIVLSVARRWLAAVVATITMAIPGLLVALMFMMMGIPLSNTNTANYRSVVVSYLSFDRYSSEWLAYLAELPFVLFSNAIYGNLVFLPILAIAGAVLLRGRRGIIVALPEKALLMTALAVFLFTNAAPPYDGWQMRGHWLARLYQPLVVVLLMIAARATQSLEGTLRARWRVALGLTVALNASVAFGPILMNPLAGFVYHKFYVHSPPDSLLLNMQRYGRRPLGFCDPSHERDGISSPKTPFNRPPFMYRYPAQ